jgi:hypothetical protein
MGNVNIFNGVEGFSGFFQAFRGENVSITFQRGNSSAGNVDEGFLAKSYQATWGRAARIDYVLNRTKPVAMLGAGQGTLSITGLVGTARGMQSILESNEQCTPLIATIRGGSTFMDCKNNTSTTTGQCVITLGNVIPQQVTINGSSENQGIDLQTASVQFVFGSFKIGSDDAEGSSAVTDDPNKKPEDYVTEL